jgi:hypothetical protein
MALTRFHYGQAYCTCFLQEENIKRIKIKTLEGGQNMKLRRHFSLYIVVSGDDASTSIEEQINIYYP